MVYGYGTEALLCNVTERFRVARNTRADSRNRMDRARIFGNEQAKLTRALSLDSISDDTDPKHAAGQTAVSDVSLIGFDTRPYQEASRSSLRQTPSPDQ